HVFTVVGAEGAVAEVVVSVPSAVVTPGPIPPPSESLDFIGAVDDAGAGAPSVTRTTRYLHKDSTHGVRVVTDEAQAVVGEYFYEPFGKRIGPDGLDPVAANGAPLLLGFQELRPEEELGWIDLGGRIYDPSMRRFLTPDPFVAEALDTQAYNRYSFVANDPLHLLDPSGFRARTDPTEPTPSSDGTNTDDTTSSGGESEWFTDSEELSPNDAEPVESATFHGENGSEGQGDPQASSTVYVESTGPGSSSEVGVRDVGGLFEGMSGTTKAEMPDAGQSWSSRTPENAKLDTSGEERLLKRRGGAEGPAQPSNGERVLERLDREGDGPATPSQPYAGNFLGDTVEMEIARREIAATIARMEANAARLKAAEYAYRIQVGNRIINLGRAGAAAARLGSTLAGAIEAAAGSTFFFIIVPTSVLNGGQVPEA
ncbi:hypothetical protein L6R52_39095, partial [Myxococcota bacterium]|nr:hypothetical protein [Myxococcota bacterium]